MKLKEILIVSLPKIVKMQRKEATFGSVCKSLNLKNKKINCRCMGEWVVGWETRRQKGGEEERRIISSLFLSSLLSPLSPKSFLSSMLLFV